jgi:arsenate reductase-like glutaredoxin family protein
VREFLARKEVQHEFEDVRKKPISAKDAVKIVRQHVRAIARKGVRIVEIDPRSATDDEIKKLFLGREGTLRAPTVSDGKTILGGFDETTLRKMS